MILIFFFLFPESQLANILKTPLFNGSALQEYILICCQRPGSGGGLLDKPDKYDFLFCGKYLPCQC